MHSLFFDTNFCLFYCKRVFISDILMGSFNNGLSNGSLFEILTYSSRQRAIFHLPISELPLVFPCDLAVNCFLPFQPLCFALQVFLSDSKLLFLVSFVVLPLSVDLAAPRPLLFPSAPFLDA